MLTKKFFWTMISLWSVTIASLIIGLSCMGQKTNLMAPDDLTSQKNGFSFIANDYRFGSVGAVLDPGFLKDVSGVPTNQDIMTQARILQVGTVFSVIMVPILAVASAVGTAEYFVISNREWKKHLPKNYVPKSRQRLMDQQAKEKETSQSSDKAGK